jgi:hypothetical protein
LLAQRASDEEFGEVASAVECGEPGDIVRVPSMMRKGPIGSSR